MAPIGQFVNCFHVGRVIRIHMSLLPRGVITIIANFENGEDHVELLGNRSELPGHLMLNFGLECLEHFFSTVSMGLQTDKGLVHGLTNFVEHILGVLFDAHL